MKDAKCLRKKKVKTLVFLIMVPRKLSINLESFETFENNNDKKNSITEQEQGSGD